MKKTIPLYLLFFLFIPILGQTSSPCKKQTALVLKNQDNDTTQKRNNVFYRKVEKDFDRAIVYLEDPHLSLSKGERSYYFAIVVFKEGKFDLALSFLKEAAKEIPQHDALIYYRAVVNGSLGNYHESIVDINKLIDLYPDEGLNYHVMGTTLFHLKNFQNAIMYYTKAIEKKFSDMASSYYMRGMAKAIVKDKSALMDIRKASELDSSIPIYSATLGKMLYSIGNYKDALLAFDRALKADSKNVDNLFNRALVKFQLASYRDSIRDADRALFLKDDFVEAYLVRGESYSFMGKHDFAIANYDQALRCHPSKDMANCLYFKRGQSNRSLKNFPEALSDFKEALKNSENLEKDVLANWAMASLYKAMGNYQKAINHFKGAIDMMDEEMYEGSAFLYHGLAQSHQALGHKIKAKEYFEQAKALDPVVGIIH